MKNFILLTVLLLTGIGFSQQVWAPVGAKWIFDYYMQDEGVSYSTVIVEKDTTINGTTCKKLYGDFVCPWERGAQYTYESNDTVYMYSVASNKFEMIYDFGASPGDTWNIACFPQLNMSEYADTIKVLVDSVGSINVSGIDLRIIYFTQTNNGFYWLLDSPVIEKIGSPVLLPGSPNCDSPVGQIRCYSDSLIDYHVGTLPCLYSDVSVETNHFSILEIFPNPVSDYLTLKGEFTKNVNYVIYDLNGQILLSGIYTAEKIDITSLQKGMYIIELVDQNKNISKFIKL